MCTAMLIAVLSFFLGQTKVLPLWLVRTHLNSIPVLVTFLYLIFWLARMRARKAVMVTANPTVAPGSLRAGKGPLSNEQTLSKTGACVNGSPRTRETSVRV